MVDSDLAARNWPIWSPWLNKKPESVILHAKAFDQRQPDAMLLVDQ
jgi:hypothetical protein